MLWLEEVDRQIATQTQAALFARALGGQAEIPDRDAIRKRFDESLRAQPAGKGDSRTAVLREAFGMTAA